jgi:hypothetical protein
VLKPFIACALLISSGWAIAAEPPLTAARYAQQLGVGMDVDWARTERGIREFDPLVVRDFRAKGITHVRIASPMSRRKRGSSTCASWWKPASSMA